MHSTVYRVQNIEIQRSNINKTFRLNVCPCCESTYSPGYCSIIPNEKRRSQMPIASGGQLEKNIL
uniref:Uncharacterized protein n=1 Tax=Ascaris lumbricoides TaxID=6252 RepID=A0A0M3IW50_ASCLU